MADRAGVAAAVTAIYGLAEDPYPAESVRWGETQRLHVGAYRVIYEVKGDLVTIDRVDRVDRVG